MDMVKLAVLAVAASVRMAAADFSIEIGSASAAMSPNAGAVQKVKNATFSVRAKDCPDVRFSGRSLAESNSKQRTEDLVFIPGSASGSFAVVKPTQGYAHWVAVITADCGDKTLGVLVPVRVGNEYNREGAKFVAHAPTPLEMEEALRAMQAASR